MDVDYEFLKKTVDARRDIARWLNERPAVGLSVLDIALLVEGFDYLASIIKDLTGQNPVDLYPEQVSGPTMTITMCEDENGQV